MSVCATGINSSTVEAKAENVAFPFCFFFSSKNATNSSDCAQIYALPRPLLALWLVTCDMSHSYAHMCNLISLVTVWFWSEIWLPYCARIGISLFPTGNEGGEVTGCAQICCSPRPFRCKLGDWSAIGAQIHTVRSNLSGSDACQ